MQICQVVLPLPFEAGFDYAIPEGMALPPIGSLVRVPFGRRELYGVVWGHAQASVQTSKIKPLLQLSPLPALSETLRQFITHMAHYSCNPLGSCLGLVMPQKEALEAAEPKRLMMQTGTASPPELSFAQHAAVQAMMQHIEATDFCPLLLEGVTGSGKTEVYMEVIAAQLKAGKQALVLFPEIALTSQMIERFAARFGFEPVLWHSGLTPATRRDSYRMIANGHARLIIGARSALCLPYADLGCIVVDEEHEPAYKQEEQVLYHARDMAVLRAHYQKIPILLVSATPSLESYHNAQSGKYHHVVMSGRYGVATLPEIQVIDMRKETLDAQHFLSPSLKEAVARTFARGEQILLYLNRRGYAPLTLCRTCGFRFCCQFCESWLVQHAHRPRLQCHHCGESQPLPKTCPACNKEDTLAACGPGVERLMEEVEAAFPEARIAPFSSDHIGTQKQAEETLHAIKHGEVDILIGTQMVAKGHHFPHLTCVGVVDSDMGLEGGDVRAAERAFCLLNQVAGRAGRESKKGYVYLQTYAPQNSLMQQLQSLDQAGFYRHELARRKSANMPPFGRLAALVFSGADQQDVWEQARSWVAQAPKAEGVRIYGPAIAPIARLRGKFRLRMLLHAPKTCALSKYMQQWKGCSPVSRHVHVKIDIDPYSFF